MQTDPTASASGPGTTSSQSYRPLLTPKAFVHKGVADIERVAKESIAKLLNAREQEEGLYGLAFHAYLRAALRQLLLQVAEDILQLENEDQLQEYAGDILPTESTRLARDYHGFVLCIAKKCEALGMTLPEAERRLTQVLSLQSKAETDLLTNVLMDAARVEEEKHNSSQKRPDVFMPTGAVKRGPSPEPLDGAHLNRAKRPRLGLHNRDSQQSGSGWVAQ